MRDNDCIFCLIANGGIPSDTVYEDENFRAVLDLAPAAKGHVLIIPKTHCRDLFELPKEAAQKIVPAAQKIAAAIREAVGADGINLVQNNGEAAGQTVMHFHLHIIPRKKGDGALGLWTPGKSVPQEQKEIAAAIMRAAAPLR